MDSEVIYKDRRHTDSSKWDGCMERFGEEDLLPLWIADMDFEAPACVKEALKKYVEFGIFGYYVVPQGYYDAFIRWEKTYHGYEVAQEWMRFSPGVVPAFNWLIHILTKEEDGVIIMPPVYYPFREAIVNNGRTPVESPLRKTEAGYEMDYEDFENKIRENNVKLFIFCTPHNPVGRVWSQEEIRRVLDICRKYHVYVIADEIHQDIIMKGYEQAAAATVGDYDDILVTLTAATKTFNLAGCQNAILVIPDERLRALYDDYLVRLRVKGGNSFGYIAVRSAYESGRGWLDHVLEIVEDNYQLMKSMLEEQLPEVWISELQGTYLMWIDLGGYVKAEDMEETIQKKCGLAVDYGAWFGEGGYDTFIRVNLATRRENIELAARRIIEAVRR